MQSNFSYKSFLDKCYYNCYLHFFKNLLELAETYRSLAEHGATIYIAAYGMNGHPSDSVLPLVVSKPEFLILPKFNQAEMTAGHLSDASTQSFLT